MDIINGLVPTVDNLGRKTWVATDIVDKRAIAKRCKRTVGTIHEWSKDPSFPAPVIVLGREKGWFWPDVIKWIDERSWETWQDLQKRVHHS